MFLLGLFLLIYFFRPSLNMILGRTQPQCEFNADCPQPQATGLDGPQSPQVCMGGQCVTQPTSPPTTGCSPPCALGQTCENGLCTPLVPIPNGWGTAPNGAVVNCRAYSDVCPVGSVCSSAGQCVLPCTSSSTCPEGSTCVQGICTAPSPVLARGECASNQTSISGLCVGSCASGVMCPSGSACWGGWCWPTGISSPCPSGLIVSRDGLCHPTCAPGSGTCSTTPGPQKCVSTSVNPIAPLVCTSACGSTSDCSFGTVCSGGLCGIPST